MSPFDWSSTSRAAATVRRAQRVARADDQMPIDEPRPADGEVAGCASEIRRLLKRSPALHRGALNFVLADLQRRLGPEARLEADAIYRQLRAEDPSSSGAHWDHALLLKHLGRFAEALEALEAYAAAGGERDNSFRWNTGICATGAGLGQKALEMWLAEGYTIALAVHERSLL